MHERDSAGWVKAQADALREGRWTDLDLEHLADEVEGLARPAMDIEEIVLRDGRRLLDVCPNAGECGAEGGVVRFASIPEGRRGYVFVEYGDAENHYVFIYKFNPGGESDFVEGFGIEQ